MLQAVHIPPDGNPPKHFAPEKKCQSDTLRTNWRRQVLEIQRSALNREKSLTPTADAKYEPTIFPTRPEWLKHSSLTITLKHCGVSLAGHLERHLAGASVRKNSCKTLKTNLFPWSKFWCHLHCKLLVRDGCSGWVNETDICTTGCSRTTDALLCAV